MLLTNHQSRVAGVSVSRTLYVAISSHGYGHIAQAAPVLNELHRRIDRLRVVVECAAPHEILARRFDFDFEHVPIASDFGMVMRDALEVDIAASHARYVGLHANLDREIDAACARLREHRADLLLANIPYVPLLAARRLGLPALAMCSLNWADIYRGLCAGMPASERIHREMLESYASAQSFIALEPGMEMHHLGNVIHTGPVANIGRPERVKMLAKQLLPDHTHLVTVSMGGIATELPVSRWPRMRGVAWVIPDSAEARRDDMVTHAAFDSPFVDILCASDALITKPGYGAFAEAACNGVPVLYVPRVDWPEAPFLVRWLQDRGTCREIGYDDLVSDRLIEELGALWQHPRPKRVAPTGIAEAADIVHSFLVQ